MSALWAPHPSGPVLQTPPEEEDAPRPVLRGLPYPTPRLARVPFLLVLIAVFGLGMTGLLMLNTTLQNQAFRVSTLHRQASELAYTQADLQGQLDAIAAPQELAARASADGLRPNPYPAFLVIPTGKVIGKPRPVTGSEEPTLIVKTPEQLAAERARAAVQARTRAAQAQVKALADAKAKALADVKAAEQAAAAKRAPKNPVTKQPVTKQPVTKQPVTNPPVTKQPAAKQPAAKQPTATPVGGGH